MHNLDARSSKQFHIFAMYSLKNLIAICRGKKNRLLSQTNIDITTKDGNALDQKILPGFSDEMTETLN